MPTINLIDETTAGGRIDVSTLDIESDDITVGELIALRVRSEVRTYNNNKAENFYGLVQPLDIETQINQPGKRAFRPIDADAQVEVALHAFRKQRFVVLLPKGQAESLEQRVRFTDGEEVSFLRLVPLVGG
jgi:hypothetical protein